MPTSVITLSTDFGEADAYVAMLKGALLRHAPGACLVDISHRLRAAPIFDAAFLLLRVYSYYPAGTIHLVGIDDGLGSRRALMAETDGHRFLAADNGVLGLVLEQGLERASAAVYAPAVASGTTFLARDVLAPLAGRLAQGVSPAAWGPGVEDWRRLALPRPEPRPDGLHGQVLHVDHFGNLLTNIRRGEGLQGVGPLRVEIAGVVIARWCMDYSEAAGGELFLLWGAEGWLEVSLKCASAAERLHAVAGTEVVMR